MVNLLRETLDILNRHGKDESNVLWVGGNKFKTTWENFKEVADVLYDAGFGSPEVAEDLIVMGDTFWLERHEYDGSEWWEFKSKELIEPTEWKMIKAVTVGQAEELGYNVSCGWETLAKINGCEEYE